MNANANGTTVKITDDSHIDHVTTPQLNFILAQLQVGAVKYVVNIPGIFTLAIVEIPAELGSLDCALIGPTTGTAAPTASQVSYGIRGEGRTWLSRIVDVKPTQTQFATVIIPGGVLATVYGGPEAPQEPGDKGLPAEKHAASVEFWSRHALARDGGPTVAPRPDATFVDFAAAYVAEEASD